MTISKNDLDQFRYLGLDYLTGFNIFFIYYFKLYYNIFIWNKKIALEIRMLADHLA